MDAEESFRAYAAARVAALSRVAYLLTGDWHLAEDLVQTTLVRVAQRWERIIAGGDPEPYVRRTMYSQHVSAWRRRRREVDIGGSVPDWPGPDNTAGVATALAVRAALVRLTTKQRAVLVLRFFEDLTETETAELLGCSVSTVKSQTRDALARLRVIAPELGDLAGRTVTR